MVAQLPPEINKEDALKRLGTSLGIDMKGLVKTPEEMQEEMQRQQMMAMVQQGLNPAITQAGQLMKQNMANNAQQAQGATGG